MRDKGEKLSDQRKADILERVTEYCSQAEMGNGDLMERVRKNRAFVAGDQWDPQVLDQNRRNGKFSVTVPIIRPKVMHLVGQYASNPRDITLVHHHGGMQQLADLQTALVKHAMADTHARFEIANWFEAGSKTGSGQLGVWINYDRDPLRGDIDIKCLNEDDVLWDPSVTTYDPNTRGEGAKYVVWRPLVDKDLVARTWPEMQEMLDTRTGLSWGARAWSKASSLVSRGISAFGFGPTSSRWATTSLDEDEYKVRVHHVWWIEYREVWYWYDLRNDKSPPILILDNKERAAAEKATKRYKGVYDLQVAVVPVMNHTIVCKDTLLENRVDELNMLQGAEALFPVVGFYPYFDAGRKSTIVDDLIGTQEAINVHRSQSVNILNNRANSQWKIARDTTGQYKDWLRRHGNQDGQVIELDKAGGLADRIQPADFPAGMEAMVQSFKNEANEITNIRTEPMDDSSRRISGVALSIMEQNARTGTSPIQLRFDQSMTIFGKLLTTIIRSTEVYSTWEITRVIDEKDLLDPQLLNEARILVSQAVGIRIPEPIDPPMQDIAQMDPQVREAYVKQLEKVDEARQRVIAKIDATAKPLAIDMMIQAMRNPQHGRYYATPVPSPASTTMKMQQFAETLEVAKLVPLPPDVIIEASNIPNKDKILSKMGAQAS